MMSCDSLPALTTPSAAPNFVYSMQLSETTICKTYARKPPFLTRKHLGTDTELFEVIENIRLDPFQPGFGTAYTVSIDPEGQIASILYPYIWGAAVDSSIASIAKDFLEREEPELPATTVIIDSVKPEKVKPYPELWEDMVRYNQNIAAQGQSGLSCAYDYQKASFRLVDYGLPDEIFGVLSIPGTSCPRSIRLCTGKPPAPSPNPGQRRAFRQSPAYVQ